MLYADDAGVLVAESRENLQHAANEFGRTRIVRLKFNADKSRELVVRKDQRV